MDNIPQNVQQVLSDTKEAISKGITGSDIANVTVGAGLIPRQNLSSLLTNLAFRDTSFYQRLVDFDLIRPGQGTAVEYNLVEALFVTGENSNPVDVQYADGGLPIGRTTKYKNVVSPYRDLGLRGSVTGRAMAQARSFVDLEAEEVANTMQALIQAIDWLCFWNRDDVASTAGVFGFKGLDQLISTNVVDAGGQKMARKFVNQVAKKIFYQGGKGVGTHMFCSAGVGIQLDNIYNTKEQLIVNMPGAERADLTVGNTVRYAKTIAGTYEIVPNYFINPGNPYPQGNPYSASSGPNGSNLSTVFMLALPYITWEELEPMSKIDLAITADKRDFMVITRGTVALRAEPWCGKIVNVLDDDPDAE